MLSDKRRLFLDNFQHNHKIGITNYLLGKIRKGEKRPDRILQFDKSYQPDWYEPFIRALQEQYNKAVGYAMYLIDWERLTPEEKKRIKQARGTEYAKEYMRTQEPTEKQLSYLKALGYTGAAPENKAQAGDLIDKILKNRES